MVKPLGKGLSLFPPTASVALLGYLAHPKFKFSRIEPILCPSYRLSAGKLWGEHPECDLKAVKKRKKEAEQGHDPNC